MSATPNFPFAITASGTYLICAAGDNVGAAGTLVQLIGNAGSTWTAYLVEDTGAGVEPFVGTPKAVINRATGYAYGGLPQGTIFGDTDSPVTVEVTGRGSDLFLTVSVFTGTGFTVNCMAAAFSTARPAGASLVDLNFDGVPIAALDTEVEADLELMVAAYNSQP